MSKFVQDYEIFDLGEFGLQSGNVIHGAKLAYKTFGELNADRSNVVVYPSWYSGFHWDNEWLIGEGMGLDPAKYFVNIHNMLSNGHLRSKTNTPKQVEHGHLPTDNV